MIRPTTRLPLADSIDADAAPRTARFRLFLALDLLLVVAVPILAWIGFTSVLDSRSGRFTAEPGPSDPGWLAFVEPSEVVALATSLDDEITGLVLVVPTGDDIEGGRIVQLPVALSVDGLRLTERETTSMVRSLERAIRLRPTTTVVLDEASWSDVLGERTVSVDNPDPVPAADGSVLLPVGPIELTAATIPAFLGRTVDSVNPAALDFRRQIFWSALLEQTDRFSPPATIDDPDLAVAVAAFVRVAAGPNRLDPLPTVADGDDVIIDVDAVSALLSDAVANPAGGGRLPIRILDRTGGNDLVVAARIMGAWGFEVVQIGNTAVFDGGPTQVLAAVDADADALDALARLLDADTVAAANDEEAVSTVTVLLGEPNPIAELELDRP